MKTNLLLIALLVSAISFSQYTAIPDTNFENALSSYDDIPNDGQVPTANISSITSLNVSFDDDGFNTPISDLTGIADFISLTELQCQENQLTNLDVSGLSNLVELQCNDNQLTSLNVSGLSNLVVLECSDNQLSSLEVGDLASLVVLICSDNQLTSLNVSQNTALRTLFCFYNNISILSVSQNVLLESLSCGNSLLNLDLTQNVNLTYLGVIGSQLSTISLSQNVNLQALEFIYNNQLLNIDLNNNTNLTYVRCENNNMLQSFDLSNNNNLTYVRCENNNNLTEFNVKNGNNTNLDYYSNGDFSGYQFYAQNNPNLSCIEVDDASWSTTNWSNIDSWVNFSSNCGATMPCLNFNFVLDTNNNIDGVSHGDIVYGDVDNDNDLDIVLCGFQNGNRATKLYINDGIGNFTINSTNSFTGVVSSFLKLVDVDGDLDLDLFICGSSSSGVISNLYLNDGLGNYTLDTANNFMAGYNASFSDIDNDGDEDLLIMNVSNNALYKNDGNGLFTMVSNTNFNNFYLGTIDFKDFNNDGYKDLILTGSNPNTPRPTELYFNDGNGNFTMVSNTGLVSCNRSAIAFSDTNNDGYLDILITGKDGSQTLLAKLFINNGNGTFSEVSNTPFDPCYNGTVEFSDFDNDGDDDVLITGQNVLNQLSPSIAKVYENLGSNSFLLKTSLQGVTYSGSICADLNNDNFIDIVNIGYTGQSSFHLYFNECATASINEIDFNKNVSIYPNPTKNQVTIKTDRLVNYKIFNITGQIIKKGNLINGENNLNISSLNQGVYFIKIADNHTEVTKKLIIK